MLTPGTPVKRFDPKEYWESRLSGNFELKAVGYSLLGRRYNEWMYRVRRKVFLREARAIKRNWARSRIFDIGSGTGFYLRLWRELGAKEIWGADLTSAAVRKLNESFPGLPVVQLDIGERLERPIGSFDAVSIFDVLFHVVDDDRYETAIQNLSEIIFPGGYLLLSDNFVHAKPTRSEHHISRTKVLIEGTLERNGFEIVRRTPMFVLMNEPVDTTSRIRRLSWTVFLKCVSQSEVVGYITGFLLYPLELVLTRLCRESATTEIMICRRKQSR